MGGAPCRLCRRGDGRRSHAARPRAGDGTEPGRPAGPDGHPHREVSLSTTARLQGTHWSRVTTTTSVAGWLRACPGLLGHDEAMEAGGREFSLHGRVVKGVGHLGP